MKNKNILPEGIKMRRTSRVSGAVFLAFAQTILLGLGYVTHILIGKLGGPSLYGIYGVSISFLTIFNMLLTLGIPVAASKEIAENEENSGSILKSALRGQIGLSLAISVFTLSFAGPLSLLLGDPSLAPIIRFTALVYPFTAVYSVFSNFFNGLHAFAIQAGIIVLYALAKLAGSVGLLFPFDVYGALSGFAVGGAVAGIVGFPYIIKSVRGHYKKNVPLKKLLTFAGAVVGTSFALQILMSMDLFLVKKILHDNTLAGYYNAASTLSKIPYFILQALGFVFLPSIARLMRENETEARVFIRQIFRYLFLLLLPVTALAATTSKSLVFLFFSSDYAPAAQPLTLLMIALGLLSSFYLLSTIAAGANKAKVPLTISWLLIPLSVLLGFFFIPRFGLSGAAMSTIFSAGAGSIAMGSYMIYRFRLSFPIATLVRGLFATAIMVFPTYMFEIRPIFVPVWYVCLAILYLSVLIILKEVNKKDYAHLSSLLPGNKNDSQNNHALES